MEGKDKRRYRRIDLQSTLTVKRIDNGINEEITVDILDVSKTGIGFLCSKELELDAIYESYITIWTKEVIHTLVKVVRCIPREDGFLIGADFMGMSEVDAFRISVYDAMQQELSKEQEK